jgi:hypothetical protein
MMRQLLLDIRPIASPSLNNYVVGANRELLNHLRAMTDGEPGASLYLGARAAVAAPTCCARWPPSRGCVVSTSKLTR